MPFKSKEAERVYRRTYYRQNKIKLAAQQLEYRRANKPKYRAIGMKWYRKHREQAREIARNCWEKNKSVYLPRKLARNAIRAEVYAGRVTKPKTCQDCGLEAKLEAHHHKGYERPFWLDVLWLCKECHLSAHK